MIVSKMNGSVSVASRAPNDGTTAALQITANLVSLMIQTSVGLNGTPMEFTLPAAVNPGVNHARWRELA